MMGIGKDKAGWCAALVILAAAAAFVIIDVEAAREETGRWRETESHSLRWLRLDEEEWRQYQSRRELVGRPLLEMTPYEVLGIYADDPQQRRRYARENARFMLDFYRRTMAFEEAYREELGKLSAQ